MNEVEIAANAARSQVNKRRARIRLIQLLIVVALMAAFYIFSSGWQAVSVFYGGCVALVYSALLGANVALATVRTGQELQALYVGAVVRFIVVAGLFILGLGWIELAGVGVVVGFGVVQLAYMIDLGLSRNDS